MKKVLFVATVVKTHIMQFHIPFLKMFKEIGWETAVAAKNDYENPNDCIIPYCDTYYDIPFNRNPFGTKNIRSYKELKSIIDSNKYNIVHCHTPVGGMIARLAARKARKNGTRVIYTAHGFHFFKGAPVKNWLLYYPAERFLAKYTDTLITINQEDYRIAQKFNVPNVEYVHGVGIDTSRFCVDKSIRTEKREQLGIADDEFILLTVGELISRKNYELVLKAIAQMKNSREYAKIQYLIVGRGVLHDKLVKLCEKLGISDRVNFLGYRSDIPDLCNISDCFVFMSKQEGLPVALMEAMACGLPAICSNIRGNTDLIKSNVNGFVTDFNTESICASIKSFMSDIDKCESYAKEAVIQIQKYDVNNILLDMKRIYNV